MKPEKDNIKNVFGSKLQNFEPELPPLMWEKIDAGLSAQQQPVKAPARRISIYKYSAAVASIAALIAITLLIFLPKNEIQPGGLAINEVPETETTEGSKQKDDSVNQTEQIEEPQTTKKEHNQSLVQSTHEFIASLNDQRYASSHKNGEANQNITSRGIGIEDERPFVFDENSEEINQGQKSLPLTEDSAGKTFIAENKEPTDNNNTPTQQTDEQFEKELGEKITDLEAYARKGEYLLADNYIPQDKKKNKGEKAASKGFQIGAGGGGAFSKSRAEQMQLRKVNYALADALESDASSNNDVALYQRQQMKMKHNQPISFGVTVSKNISNRVSLETGITYTYLSSKYESDGSSDLDANDSQHFHYLGIPLAINYRVFEWNKLQVYLTGGGQIQKDFYGRMKTSQNAPALSNAQDYEKKNISQKHPQFSVNTSVGLSYPLYNKLAVYTNVGGAYYFDAKNEYETIYSDRKWHLSLNMGIKFEF